ncbi:hypothetical protein EOS_23250 [Caballeronia mineralivorans PML1(12)]|uniref:DUF72 domain-containing protein n=1 Tax=Caballeronia mineralivorans PML1(12) TaxID=908627 RepID=A0A0J1CU46_9BURK|nr:DUF72 domain-containing protein [Caballeronia mineralivorans]KLU23861.1 hypothetical protein EOS_23250 [Caballeronia mineralivorans PML1(12)]
MTILVGTASWTDPTLIKCKRFYPPGCSSAEARLRHYASVFPLVEVDSSYYAMPNPANSVLWAERAPPGFVFNIKAFRLFTGHQTARDMFPPDIQPYLPQNGKTSLYYKDLPGELQQELWCRYLEAIEPLRAAGKLGAVHFQFAPWVICNPHGIRHVEHCADVMGAMDAYTMAVEFRNQTWFDEKRRDSTLALERERGLVNVVVDEPQGSSNSIPAIWETTHPRLALIRLHGRNQETWNIKGGVASSSRFKYEYNEDELGSIASQIIEISKAVELTHVVLNTNYEDQGQRNALKLMRVLGVTHFVDA